MRYLHARRSGEILGFREPKFALRIMCASIQAAVTPLVPKPQGPTLFPDMPRLVVDACVNFYNMMHAAGDNCLTTDQVLCVRKFTEDASPGPAYELCALLRKNKAYPTDLVTISDRSYLFQPLSIAESRADEISLIHIGRGTCRSGEPYVWS
jgi:hypothetical protein